MDLSLLNIPSNKIKQLQSKNIYNLMDLLKYIPTKYYDFRVITKISEINQKENEMCAFVGRVESMQIWGNGKVLAVKINDGTGILNLTWFQKVDYIKRMIDIGKTYIFYGKPTIDKEYHNMKKMSPIFFNENIEKNKKIVPVYKKIKGMADDYLKNLINTSLAFFIDYSDFLIPEIKKKFNLIDEYDAFKKIHQPKSLDDIEKAKKRFIFDDLFTWNFILKSQQNLNMNSDFVTNTCKTWHTFLKKLPFELTQDQINTLKNIYTLMKNKKRVNALIQGDVGSGKTIVAEFVLAVCAENGFQSCLIAPTEVLAKQHYDEIKENFKNLNIDVGFLIGNTSSKERKELLDKLKDGSLKVIVGTHAIMSKDVVFNNLGMVICDEEHRFGVLQREFYKKDDDYYIENIPYVNELNKYLKKLKEQKCNIFFRNIDLENIDISKELSIYKDIDSKDKSLDDLNKEIYKKLELLDKEQKEIISLSSNDKYTSLKQELIDLLSNNKKTNKFFKELSKNDIYALYYIYMDNIKEILKKTKDIPIPHQITMSATPIPRTLAMSIYGDNIRVFTIKTKPNGRKPIITSKMKNNDEINKILLKELSLNHQIYIVCPLIEDSESEKMAQVESVASTYEYYKNFFKKYNKNVGIVTGNMKKEDIDDNIKKFMNNENQILVATSVIEVGVSCPNATVMVIKSSDRFGLSSLHQIRGRVGRSNLQSYCILQPNNLEDKKAEIMCSTTNGFEIAKFDLELRGSGNILGTRQSGQDYYVSLMLSNPDLYDEIVKLNNYIYNDKKLFEKYSFLLDSIMYND